MAGAAAAPITINVNGQNRGTIAFCSGEREQLRLLFVKGYRDRHRMRRQREISEVRQRPACVLIKGERLGPLAAGAHFLGSNGD